MISNIFKNNYLKILCIILFSLLIDNLFILAIDNPPAWDQGYHLSNVFKMFNILDAKNLSFFQKYNDIFRLTDSYRGPLTYFLSGLFLKIFNNSYHYAYLSNQIFNIICIVSIFNLGKIIKNESVGIWASILFTFSELVLKQRSDYLIDLSLTSFSILNLFFFSKWYFKKEKTIIYSILSGISLGLIFLVKPTGIILFFLPFLLIIIKICRNNINYIYKITQIFLFNFSFFIVIFPWFSINWLTIISNIINAWNWGLNYQDGLDINSIESWIYYFKRIPLIFGIINSSVFFTIFLLEKIAQKSLFKINFKYLNNVNLWFLFFTINCYLIMSLMSTKDIRFVLPLYPLICIYLTLFIQSNEYKIFPSKSKKHILIMSLFISLFINNKDKIYDNLSSKSLKEWPHSDIISTIKNENPNLVSTLAILPDTKEINTFNIEAEASKQGEHVVARQIVSNKMTYKDDLKFFDWFLVKTGDQGVMTNEAKELLHKYLLNNNSFVLRKEWQLSDKSKVILLRRKFLNTYLKKYNCSFNSPYLNIEKINNGINISLFNKGKYLQSSYLLLDFLKNKLNISLANGFFHRNFDPESCYYLSQNISLDSSRNDEEQNILIKGKLINKDNNIKVINIGERNIFPKREFTDDNYIKMSNRIYEVEKLGNFLRKGEFSNLFNLVGIINQSDPKQIYLKDAENIYFERYKENNNLKDLYSILISQILQRKVKEAEKTINIILEIDSKNGNTHLAKSIISVYLFDKEKARKSINDAKVSEISNESYEILKTFEGLIYLLEMKFINAYKIFI